MTTLMFLGAGFGLGLSLLTVWLVPPRPALGPQLAHTPPTTEDTATSAGWRHVLDPITTVLRAAGLPTRGINRDFMALDRSVRGYLIEKATLAMAGLLIPLVGAAALGLAGVDVGVRVPGIVVIGCTVVGFLIPDHRVRRQATRRRTDFRHALSAFLDLVVISLAGGAGVDSALTGAASTGHNWAFTRIQRALLIARITRTTPWTALRQLGRDLDIPELTELAASVSLAGTEGAKVRHSLHAKASTLRTSLLTEAEAIASADTERMSLPVMALFLGFLCFITYPAVTQILTGL